jgi:hypothetical protein
LPPTCARQATSDSRSPKIDVFDRRFRNRLPIGDIRELQIAARPQHTFDFRENSTLVGAQIDHAVADDHIGPAILDGQFFRQPFAKFDITETQRRRRRSRFGKHRVRHIDANDAARRADLTGRDKGIETGTRSNVDDALALGERPQRERIGDTGEGLHRRIRQRIDYLVVVSETGGKPASGVEVVGAMRINGDLAILTSHFRTQGVSIDGCVPTRAADRRRCAVGAPFAVLVAEQLFVSGCEFLVSVTSAGQIAPVGPTPYFVLIDRALRDEGTSHHYLPPSVCAEAASELADRAFTGLTSLPIVIHRGTSWTTDAPYRETEDAIAAAHAQGALAVEMEAAALYAFARASGKPLLCFAHVTNQMARIEGDFEKGESDGTRSSIEVIAASARACGFGPILPQRRAAQRVRNEVPAGPD